jgi:hypothetical protein
LFIDPKITGIRTDIYLFLAKLQKGKKLSYINEPLAAGHPEHVSRTEELGSPPADSVEVVSEEIRRVVEGVAAAATAGNDEAGQSTRQGLANTLALIGRGETGEADRSTEVFALNRSPDNYYEIEVSSEVTLADYKERTSSDIWDLMLEETEPLVGKNLIILSSTYEGGGVAMQEPPLINFLTQRGVNVRWLVSEPNDAAFVVTKKMHNLQQDMLEPEVQWTEEDAAAHLAYGKDNIVGMMRGKAPTAEEKANGVAYNSVEGFADADAYWIEDPQLAGGIPYLMGANPTATYVYRNHIQTDRDLMATEDSPQQRIHRHIHETCGVDQVDAYAAHPVAQFTPYRSDGTRYKEAYMPPVSDDFEDLIRDLTPEEIADKQAWLNGQIAKQNSERRDHNASLYGEEHAELDDQALIDWESDLIVDFARFDLAKFHECAMMLQKAIVDKSRVAGVPDDKIRRMVIAGNGATDDPDRTMVLNKMLELRRTEFAEYADFITVVGLQHDYSAVNALLRSSKYTANLSKKEGFEHRRTESMMKGVPSISSNRGGLPLQGQDGEGGMVMDYDDFDAELDRVATEIVADTLNPAQYESRRQATVEWADFFSKPELTTVANVIREARIINGRGDRTWYVRDLAEARQRRVGNRVLIGSTATLGEVVA